MISFRTLAVFLFGGVALVSAQPAAPIFPFEPVQLVAVLPAAPADWKVTRSVADGSLGEWLETRATRVFQAPPPESGARADAPPGEVEISVVDTAGFGPALAAFADFKPGKNGAIEKKLFGSLPALVITGESDREIVQLLVSARYIVEITFTHLPQHRTEDWLRGFHFDALPAASPTPTTRPREFRLTHVDELHPQKNRSYLVSVSQSKRVSEFFQTLPAEKSSEAAAAR